MEVGRKRSRKLSGCVGFEEMKGGKEKWENVDVKSKSVEKSCEDRTLSPSSHIT